MRLLISGKSKNGDRRGTHPDLFFLSFIVLVKLVNIIILLAMIFMSFIIIKKILIVTVFALPVLLRNLQRACQLSNQRSPGIFDLLKPITTSSNLHS